MVKQAESNTSLDIEFVMLANSAEMAEGKLYVMGGAFSTVTPDRYPTLFPFSVVTSVSVPPAAAGLDHKLSISFRGPDESQQGTIQATVSIGPQERSTSVPARSVLIVGARTMLASPGVINVTVQFGRKKKSLAFEALPPVPSPGKMRGAR